MYSLSINTQPAWKPLKQGDRIAIVAPSRQGKAGELDLIHDFLDDWGLEAHIPDTLLGEDLLCANTDELRFKHLVDALNSPDYAAVWCLRGGYGCTRLMPELIKLKTSQHFKWFIGFSDITVLHSWLNNQWQWPTIHGSSLRQLACNEVDELTVKYLKEMLFGQQSVLNYQELIPLNPVAKNTQSIQGKITGGNLSLLEASIATPWQFISSNKMLLIEEVDETAYRIDRSLNHLLYAQLVQQASAIILGDFNHIDPQQERTIDQVLQLFANECTNPVYRLRGIGHGERNWPIPLEVEAVVQSRSGH